MELPTLNEEELVIEEQQAAVAKASGAPKLSHGSHRHPTRDKTRHCNMSEEPKLRFNCNILYVLSQHFGNYCISIVRKAINLLLQRCLLKANLCILVMRMHKDLCVCVTMTTATAVKKYPALGNYLPISRIPQNICSPITHTHTHTHT